MGRNALTVVFIAVFIRNTQGLLSTLHNGGRKFLSSQKGTDVCMSGSIEQREWDLCGQQPDGEKGQDEAIDPARLRRETRRYQVEDECAQRYNGYECRHDCHHYTGFVNI